MPEFEVTSPDGQKFIVTAPEGASQDEIIRYAQQNIPKSAEPEWQKAAPSEQPGILASLARGVGLGTRAAIQGIGSLPGMVYDAARAPGQLITAGINAATGANIPKGYNSRDILTGTADLAGLPNPETEGERMTSGIVEALGATGAGIGAGRAMAGATNPTVQAIGRALAAQPKTQLASAATGAAVSEATDSPVAGIAASMATPLAIAGARRVVTPAPSALSPGRAALVQGAENEGIPLTAGQATGSRFLQNIESQLEQLPLTAGPQRDIREGQNRAFIAAALRRAGVNADDTTPATINAARARIGGTIGTIANRNTLRVTPQFTNDLDQMEQGLRFLPAEAAGPVGARIEQLRGMVANGVIPGPSYRAMDTAIGRNINSTGNPDLKTALGELRDTVRAAMDASISPADAADWQEARRQYANLMTVATAAKGAGAGAAEGMMSPVALRGALDASTGRGYGFGRGDLNELARIGQALIRPPPDAGTAGRMQAQGYLTGSAMTGGGGVMGAMLGGPMGAALGAATGVVMPRLIQVLMNSDAGQAYLKNQRAASPTITRDLILALLAQQPAAAQRGQE